VSGWLILAAFALLAAAAWITSLWVHPWIPCKSCDGSGKTRDPVFRSAFGTCPRCGGRGRKPRLAVRVLQPSRGRRMTGAEPSHKTADHRRQP
jgi:hypothetical protein